MTDDDKEPWSSRLFEQLIEAGVRLFAYVPDAGNARLIELAEAHNEARPAAFRAGRGAALVLSQKFLGAKAF